VGLVRGGSIAITRAGWAGRVQPGDRTSLADLTKRDPDGDACQPRTERSVTSPARERSICGHECLLGSVLGLVEVSEDSVAGPDDRRRFSLDDVTVRVTVACEDRVDHDTVTALIVRFGG
jgi:hypothetical protein